MNKTVNLSNYALPRSLQIPREVRLSSRRLLQFWKKLRKLKEDNTTSCEVIGQLTQQYKELRSNHRKLVRSFKAQDSIKRDSMLLNNPAVTYAKIRKTKRSNAGKISKLVVNSDTYFDQHVQDGFYASVHGLKTCDRQKLENSSHFQEALSDYSHIIELCKASEPLGQISETEAFNLLMRMKPNVPDYFSVTPNHYIYAGPSGWRFFHMLLNLLLQEVRHTSISEINLAYACILFKGHGKDRCNARSYRTISTCPVVAKALDLFLRDKKLAQWNSYQAPTQFQGSGSSHDFAAILLTECVQFSLHSLDQPLFALYLDAKSAFDVVQRILLIKNLFSAQSLDQSILYVDNRLANRNTVVDWNGCLMGPISDEQGLEQGGCNSSEFYKIFGKEQLEMAQHSELGVPLGDLCISAIGQADDTVLVSNSIYGLQYLLHLTSVFCKRNLVELCADKTKLQAFSKSCHKNSSNVYHLDFNPIKINGKEIPLSPHADHVGVLRSVHGNQPTLLARFAAHRAALASVLHTGIARGHRGNPASSVKIHELYALPVLLSGLTSLVLTNKELGMIENHYRETLRRLLRLHSKTPRCVIYFLSGSLPGDAFVHLRQLSTFGMICRQPENILHRHAVNLFTARTISPKSWFHQIRNHCIHYGLPHPIDFLSYPLDKLKFKRLVKKKIID